jgi:hypothetical protein
MDERGHRRGDASPSRAIAWISWLFAIGSACFTVASIPMLAAAVPHQVLGVVYVVGSVFFTSAAAVVLATTPRATAVAWWAAVIQLAGTLWFNVNTVESLADHLSTRQEILRVWTPDFIGSICFIVASVLAWWVVCRRPWCWRRADNDWLVAAWNLLGSLLFLVAAFAAFIRPDTGDALDASLANSATLLGAVCFLVGARLLLRPPAPDASDGTAGATADATLER